MDAVPRGAAVVSACGARVCAGRRGVEGVVRGAVGEVLDAACDAEVGGAGGGVGVVWGAD